MRIFELDVLRGVAVLMVIGSHLPVYPVWSNTGVFGVDLFFVLSGFLISSVLFKEYREKDAIDFPRFFLRRARRIYPAFGLLLLATPALRMVHDLPVTRTQWLAEFTMMQSYVPGIWGHTWTLGVEEHFYVLLPVLFWGMLKVGRREDPFAGVMWVFGVLAVACVVLRFHAASVAGGYYHRAEYEPSHLRFDSLFFGVLLGYLHAFRPKVLQVLMRAPYRLPIAFAGVIALAPAIVLDLHDAAIYTWGFTSIYFGFGVLVLLAVYKEREQTPGPFSRGIAKVGIYSYTTYLWNFPLAEFGVDFAAAHPHVNHYLIHAVYFVATLVVGVVTAEGYRLCTREGVWLSGATVRMMKSSFPSMFAKRCSTVV